jgi:hypothetical protein
MGHYVVYRDEGTRRVASQEVGAPAIGDWPPPRCTQEAIDLLKQYLFARGKS